MAPYSDVHANVVALDAVLHDISRSAVSERYCLGDLVGYGPGPSEVTDQVRTCAYAACPRLTADHRSEGTPVSNQRSSADVNDCESMIDRIKRNTEVDDAGRAVHCRAGLRYLRMPHRRSGGGVRVSRVSVAGIRVGHHECSARPDGFDPFENSISPSEVTYLAFDRERLVIALKETYAANGYMCPYVTPLPLCPGHIGVELDFMRYCLERVAGGEPGYLRIASRFFGSHLKEWGVLFAVVLREKATHPALTYLSYALDKFIACETITFRQSLPSLCVQRLLTD